MPILAALNLASGSGIGHSQLAAIIAVVNCRQELCLTLLDFMKLLVVMLGQEQALLNRLSICLLLRIKCISDIEHK